MMLRQHLLFHQPLLTDRTVRDHKYGLRAYLHQFHTELLFFFILAGFTGTIYQFAKQFEVFALRFKVFALITNFDLRFETIHL